MENFEFLKIPYLPEKEAKVFIADAEIKGAIVIKPPKMNMLEKPISCHADLSICMVSQKKAVCPPESCAYYKLALGMYGFSVIEGKTNLGKHYPKDSAYNVCIVGNKCFVNTKICDPVLLETIYDEGKEIIHVPQGYTKCSICPIDENTIIAADDRICAEARKRGMECLLISNEGVHLDGYNYGFFGGACGMISSNKLLVNGEISTLKSAEEIKKFLSERKIEIKSIKKGKVLDIGSIIPVMQ